MPRVWPGKPRPTGGVARGSTDMMLSRLDELRTETIRPAKHCLPHVPPAASTVRRNGALIAWLNAAGCQHIIGADAPSTLADLARHPKVRAHVHPALARWNAAETGSSHRVSRVILLGDPPSIDANEITDKGYINQRLALQRRQAEVARLYAEAPDETVIVVD
jgi:hypothetical protein